MKKILFIVAFGAICTFQECGYTEPIDNPTDQHEDTTCISSDTIPNPIDNPTNQHEDTTSISSDTIPNPQNMSCETTITGTSPYIPLTDDYFLIDWKWLQLLPLSCLTNYSNSTQLLEHIQKHIFLTGLHWKDLTDLKQKWYALQYTQPVCVSEIWRISIKLIDRTFNEEKSFDPYLCYNMSLYQDGMSVENAYLYYRGESVGTCHQTDTYKEYISYCDSLQQVYRQHLIEMINDGQLKSN